MQTRYVNSGSSAGGDGTTNATSGANRAYVSTATAWSTHINGATLSDNWEFLLTGSFTSSMVSGGPASAAGFTVTIKPNSGQRHAGTWDAAKTNNVRTTSGAIASMVCGGGTIKFEGLQLEISAASGSSAEVIGTASNGTDTGTIIVDGCIIRQTGGTRCNGIKYALTNASHKMIVANCIIQGLNIGISCQGDSKIYDYSNTLWDNTNGINNTAAGTNHFATNNVSEASSAAYSQVDTMLTCIANDTSGTIDNTTLTFVNDTGGNFNLASGDTAAIGAGTDMSADSIYPFNWDITGNTRTGAWDIGCFDYASSGVQHIRPKTDLRGQNATMTGSGTVS